MTGHLVAGVAAAVTLVIARRRGWLTGPATAAAAGVGTAVWIGAGAAGVGLLLLFFVSSSALGRLPTRRDRRVPPSEEGAARSRPPRAPRDQEPRVPSRSGPAVYRTEGGEEGRPRGARQVLANGGAAAAAALALPPLCAASAVLGALAAATADTWSSEVGRAVGGGTRRVTDGRRVRPGTPGGVSAAGTAAGLTGAALLGVAAAAMDLSSGGDPWIRSATVALIAGAAGAFVDSVLGAVGGGPPPRPDNPGLDNDLINLLATATGAAAAVGAGAALG